MESIKLIIDISKKRIWTGRTIPVLEGILKTLQTIKESKTLRSGKVFTISVRMTDDREIQKVNYRFRGKNKPTNVLSFQMIKWKENILDEMPLEMIAKNDFSCIYSITEKKVEKIKVDYKIDKIVNLGDLILSYETIAREAEEKSQNFDLYLKFITVHGMLHLLGYDHENEQETEEMAFMEKSVMEKN